MYVPSTDPIPQNSMTPDGTLATQQSDVRKQRTFTSVMWAASRYACAGTIPPEAFPGFGLNFQYQVSRAASLLNSAMATIAKESQAQKSLSSSGTSGAPKVVPLNPVDTRPQPKPDIPQQGPFDTPMWGDYQGQFPGICTPGQSILNWIQSNPWWAIGGVAAVALASGAVGSGIRRRRRAA